MMKRGAYGRAEDNSEKAAILAIRMTPEQKRRLQQAAKREGIVVSEYVRRIIEKQLA